MSDERNEEKAPTPGPVEDQGWGKKAADHFGYGSESERLAKRGLEDWELVDKIPESQRGVPVWFLAVVVVVLLVAVGLSFPFWGDRPGYERSWWNWGFTAALIYFFVASVFIYFMVNLYGSHIGGRLDNDESDEAGGSKGKKSEDEGKDAR
jgi:hypothetical protein